ncbi:uncharacterized protein M421DRAFT_94635 [Didymella exigua CBS 183.55]|uniref:Uncharacterized protein n=1 Tax=Didymella exigua CBS 183.55 TaxID=1150837 RepID=A0A6A5RBD9_9PLEO|nr:uncharacterized protein M421DRAFT_94635 [Didymella exigua CBS 183.55]KAF1925551.1 hypothetical protein M421DRAFT_94635 [Didymella exigua CBS 183.55]
MGCCRADALGRLSFVSGPARSRETLLTAGPFGSSLSDAAAFQRGETHRNTGARVQRSCQSSSRYTATIQFPLGFRNTRFVRDHLAALPRMARSVQTRLAASHGTITATLALVTDNAAIEELRRCTNFCTVAVAALAHAGRAGVRPLAARQSTVARRLLG